jgi:hypothetical protein
MGYPTRVQVIRRKASQQWYVNFPAVLARAMDFAKGEVVEWTVQDKNALTLQRTAPQPPSAGKKKRQAS